MPIIIGLICLFPLLIGVVVQYLVQRLFQKRLLRLIPTGCGTAVTILVAVARWHIWTSEEVSPLTQILFIPMLPAVFYFVGLFLGRRLYKRLWDPRVVNEK